MDSQTLILPRLDGGKEAITVALPPRLRRYSLISMAHQAGEAADPMVYQYVLTAALAVCYQGELPGAGRRLPLDLSEAAEVAVDGFHELGIDTTHADFIEAASQCFTMVAESVSDATADEEATTEAAEALFPKGAPADSTDDAPSSAS